MTQITTTPDSPTPSTVPLKYTVIASLLVGLVIMLAALIFFPTRDVFLGILTGLAIGVINYVLLVKIIESLVRPQGNKSVMALLLVAKMFSLLGLIALAFWILNVNVVAFFFGFMSLILVIVLQNFVSSMLVKG